MKWDCVREIDLSKLPNIESEIYSFIFLIDSSLTHSILKGQVNQHDITDFNKIEAIIHANLQLINTIKNDTISIITDFNGRYLVQLPNGVYDINVTFPHCNSLRLTSLKINSFELLSMYITLGYRQGTTIINADNLMNAK